MYAYVRYLADGQKEIVPVEAIKNFDYKKFNPKCDTIKKFKIKWNNGLYEGTVIYIGSTEAELEEKIQKCRPRIPPADLARTDESDHSDSITQSKETTQSTTENLQNLLTQKLQKVVHEQGQKIITSNCSVPSKVLLQERPHQTIINREVEKYSESAEAAISASPNPLISTTISTPKSSRCASPLAASTPGIRKKPSVDAIHLETERLKKEIVILKRKAEESNKMVSELTQLNMDLQRNILNEFNEFKAMLTPLVRNENNHANDILLPIGYRRSSTNNIHLGLDVWLPIQVYESVVLQSKTSAQFVKNMAVAVFGIKTLKNSSITGKSSNRTKSQPRPKLDSKKILAIKAILRYWLATVKLLDEPSIDYEAELVTTHITKKISEYNKKPKVKLVLETDNDEEFTRKYLAKKCINMPNVPIAIFLGMAVELNHENHSDIVEDNETQPDIGEDEETHTDVGEEDFY